MSQTQCVRCRANKQNGDRCTRRTCKYSKYCYQHAKKLDGLRVTQSNIPNAGLGLFATKQFRKGQKVADYGGQIVSTASYRENPSGYGIQINRAVILDAKSQTQGGLGLRPRWSPPTFGGRLTREITTENNECCFCGRDVNL